MLLNIIEVFVDLLIYVFWYEEDKYKCMRTLFLLVSDLFWRDPGVLVTPQNYRSRPFPMSLKFRLGDSKHLHPAPVQYVPSQRVYIIFVWHIVGNIPERCLDKISASIQHYLYVKDDGCRVALSTRGENKREKHNRNRNTFCQFFFQIYYLNWTSLFINLVYFCIFYPLMYWILLKTPLKLFFQDEILCVITL